MNTTLTKKVQERYIQFMKELDINLRTGILGKISNPRYQNNNLRFSGLPYIGSKYENAKKKILFVGLDIGIDELRELNTYHTISSRKECIAGSKSGCTSLGYNEHFSGTYAMALYILQNEYSWNEQWSIFEEKRQNTFRKTIDNQTVNLPLEVLDYVAFTNVHKFVSICRGCDLNKFTKPICFSNKCNNTEIHRSGSNNRKWYSPKEEIRMLLDEIEIFNPDVLYFQGSSSAITQYIPQLNLKHEIWIADHPSAWSVRANTPDYVNSSRIRIMPKVGL